MEKAMARIKTEVDHFPVTIGKRLPNCRIYGKMAIFRRSRAYAYQIILTAPIEPNNQKEAAALSPLGHTVLRAFGAV